MRAEPTEQQRRLFCEMMSRAFIEMRGLGSQGKSEQAAALADAFHNLPIMIYQPDFDWAMSRYYFEAYNRQYPPKPTTMTPDYVAMHDRVEAAGVEDATG